MSKKTPVERRGFLLVLLSALFILEWSPTRQVRLLYELLIYGVEGFGDVRKEVPLCLRQMGTVANEVRTGKIVWGRNGIGNVINGHGKDSLFSHS